jgi:hypothetical protein
MLCSCFNWVKAYCFCFRSSFKTFSMLRQVRHTSKAQYISKVCSFIRAVKFKLTEFLDVCLYMRSQTAESNLQHFRLNFFASYFLSYIKRIVIHTVLKLQVYLLTIALYSLFFPLPAVCYERQAETLYL